MVKNFEVKTVLIFISRQWRKTLQRIDVWNWATQWRKAQTWFWACLRCSWKWSFASEPQTTNCKI